LAQGPWLPGPSVTRVTSPGREAMEDAGAVTRALIAWCFILAVAIGSGAIREKLIRPHVGFFGAELFGLVTVGGATFIAALIVVSDWPSSPILLGSLWLGMTISFEFLFFHYAGGRPWTELLDAYRFWSGRLWTVLLLVVWLSPALAAKLRGS
jgi:hypothetical protein